MSVADSHQGHALRSLHLGRLAGARLTVPHHAAARLADKAGAKISRLFLDIPIDPFWPAIVFGGIANLIVIEQAAACGVNISFRDHARVGIPVALVSLAVLAAWMEA